MAIAAGSDFIRHPLVDRPAILRSRRFAGHTRCHGAGPVQVASLRMVVDHPDGLKVGIDDRRADEAEAPLFEVARDPVAQLGAGGYLAARPPAVDDRAAADPVPEIAVEGAELLLDGEKSLRIGHRG